MAGNNAADSPFDDEAEGEDEPRESIDHSADVDSDDEADVDSDDEADVDSDDEADVDSGAEGGAAGDGESDDSAPFAALDAGDEVEEPFVELDAGARESPREFPDEELAGAGVDGDAAADPFEEMEVEDLDEEEIWAALSEGEAAGVELAGEATPVETEEGVEDHIVDKREYCQQCPHFTEPPTVSCSHEGTEIVEVVSTDEFRVRGCPMIGKEGPTFKRE